MSKLSILLLVLFTFSGSFSQAQNIIRCNTDEKAFQAYDDYDAFQKSIDKGIKKFYENPSNNKSSVVITIPVHVIIVHPPGEAIGTGSNLSVARIQSQVDVLTEDFRRLNSDAGNTPAQFAAADTEIEFCLAVIDENGNPTDGITRYATNQNMNSNENAIKSATGWDRDEYLNMWSAPNLGGLLGWAYLPSTTGLPNSTLDGIVVATGSFGGPGEATNAPYHLGRTATHEVGHYLGLRHIWRSNGCGADDGFADTPLQDDENFGCPNHPSTSCSNSGDMFMNYMDYVNDNCMNAFTADQGDYMQLILNTSRSSLLGSAAIVCNSTPPLEIDLVFSQDILCNGNNTGSLEVEATGGTPSYQYNINNGAYQSTGLFQNLVAGTYLVGVLDDNGTTNSITVEITEPTSLSSFISVVNNNPCAGYFDGSAFIELAGGTAPYLVNGQQVNGSTFAITNLPQGDYSAFVTDANQCSQVLDFTITDPLPITLSIDQITHVTCFGQSNGGFSYSIFGGTPTYTVKLDNSVLNSNIITNLIAGDYQLDIEDDNGCTYSETITIEQPEELIAEPIVDQSEICFGANDGIATINTEGGTAPYNYFLDNNPPTSTNVFENLSAGLHQVNIIDLNGCSSTTSFTIQLGYSIESTITNIDNAACGQSTGSISVIGSEGSAPYNYAIPASNLANQSGVFSDLPAGNYTIEITDMNGCTVEQVATIIEETAAELVLVESVNFICFGSSDGAVTLDLEEANGNSSYSMDGQNFQESPAFQELPAGDYTFYATDDTGCISLLNVTIQENPQITYEYEVTNPLCAENGMGSIQAIANGGTGSGYNYELASDPGNTNMTGLFENLSSGSDLLTIIDANGCTEIFEFTVVLPEALAISNISTVDTDCFESNSGSASFESENNQGNVNYSVFDLDGNPVDQENLFAGNYNVEATDENGCKTSSSFEILDASPIEWNIIQSTDASCDGSIRGTATFEALTGEAPFTYNVGQNTNETGEFDNFNAGTYELTITDNTGCSRIVQFDIGQLESFSYQVDEITNIACFGDENGTATLVTDDNDNYQYRMNGVENETGLFTDLGVGEYPYEIENSENCIVYDTLIITGPTALNFVIEEEIVNDNDLTDITLAANGGTPPYQYNLDGGDYQDSPIFTDIENGDHTFTVIDANNCEQIISQVVADIDNAELQNIQIYPNPFNDELIIKMDQYNDELSHIEIISIDGKMIQTFTPANKEKSDIRLDLSEIPGGIYLLRLATETSSIHKRIVKN